jgi:hypothetical protein
MLYEKEKNKKMKRIESSKKEPINSFATGCNFSVGRQKKR